VSHSAARVGTQKATQAGCWVVRISHCLAAAVLPTESDWQQQREAGRAKQQQQLQQAAWLAVLQQRCCQQGCC